MSETVSLEVAIEVVLRDGPTFETIAGLCKMAVEAERNRFALECIDLVAMYGGPVDLEAAIRARGQA
jgi:hypothetical protein